MTHARIEILYNPSFGFSSLYSKGLAPQIFAGLKGTSNVSNLIENEEEKHRTQAYTAQLDNRR